MTAASPPFLSAALALAMPFAGLAAQEAREGGLPCEVRAALPLASVRDALSDFERAAELAGATPMRNRLFERVSSHPRAELCTEDVPWSFAAGQAPTGPLAVEVMPASVGVFLNTTFPDDRNNGSVWAGRGVSTSLTGGGRLRWRSLSLGIAPVVAYQQNRDYDVFPSEVDSLSPFIYARPGEPVGRIDLPQRFGDEAFWTVHPGGSYLRVDPGFLSAGISTENLWWGPGIRNSILMSNTAGGFPHAFVGTPGPVDVGIGRIEAEAVWGRLEESDYFDFEPDNDSRLFQGLVVTFSPEGAPGLHLGIGRVFYEVIPPEGLPFSRHFRFFEGGFRESLATPENPEAEDAADQMLSLFGRWAFPEIRFEVYGEWARNDSPADFEELVNEPSHSQGYTLGLQKLFGGGEDWIRLHAELTHLGISTTAYYRTAPTFYAHDDVRQGYTHRGQLLGAGIGPGADSQFMAMDFFRPWGRAGLFLERYRRNVDAVYRLPGHNPHDVDVGGGLRGAHRAAAVTVGWTAAFQYRWSPYYIRGSTTNTHLGVHLVWVP